MAEIHVIGGDFPRANGSYGFGKLHIKTSRWQWLGPDVAGLLVGVQVVSSHSGKSFRDAVGLGAVGSLLYGSAGFFMGLILGGNKKECSFIGILSDGRRFIAKARPRIVDKLIVIALRNASALDAQEQHADGSIPMSAPPPDGSIPMD